MTEPRTRSAGTSGAANADPVEEALLAAFRHVLAQVVAASRRGAPLDESAADGLRAVCVDARRLRLPITRVLLTLKAAWQSLPPHGRAGWFDADAVLERVVTTCIREYYRAGAGADDSPASRPPMIEQVEGPQADLA